MKCEARGNQGNWFAKVNAPRHPEIHEQDLPCIRDFWSNGRRYQDEGFDPSVPKFRQLVKGLRDTGHVVMRRRNMELGADEWRSAGNIAVFKIDNIVADEFLTFDFIERVCNL